MQMEVSGLIQVKWTRTANLVVLENVSLLMKIKYLMKVRFTKTLDMEQVSFFLVF